jgi:outer membrane lipoprotein-sorting protein
MTPWTSRLCVAALLLVGSAGAEPAAARPTLASLLGSLQKSPGVSADFVETKKLTLLETPLESRGSIYFERPAKLARHVREPASSRMILDRDELTISEGGKTRRVDVRQGHVVRGLVEAFVLLLGGRRAELERRFRMEFAVALGARWTLSLVPKDAAMRKTFAGFDFTGSGLVVTRMRIRQTNGDVTTMAFENVRTQRRFTAAEEKRFFGARRP